MAAGLLIFGAANTARAELVLSYQESGAQLQFVATDNGTTTTFRSTPITVLIKVPRLGLESQIAYMRFDFVQSIDTADLQGRRAPQTIQQDYTGQIEFNSNKTFSGINYLTAIFTNPNDNTLMGGTSNPASFTATNGGATASLTADSTGGPKNKDTLSYTSSTPLTVKHGTENFGLTFSGLTPAASIHGSTINQFAADGTGSFNAEVLTPPFPNSVPEPTTVVGAALAGFMALGFGLRRRRTSVA